MIRTATQPRIFNSVAEVHAALGLPAPLHPLVSLNNYKDITTDAADLPRSMVMNLYKISYKKYFSGQLKYGQQHYNFESGGLCFMAPMQLITENEPAGNYDGFTLLVHPDFIRPYPLGKNIREYGFFSYAAAEALQLAEKEKQTVMRVFGQIEEELAVTGTEFSQDIVVSLITLLLQHSSRFYKRQLMSRNAISTEVLTRLELLLDDYFNSEKALMAGIPTVQYLSAALHLSPGYLSDLLRSLTGQNTQQHIHNKLIEKAKEILSVSTAPVSEVAYRLGFGHPQSFSKIFKRKTSQTPQAFRQSFNTIIDLK